ncbi:MAG: hypothetical protein M1826_001816 [Phylliscum demangeonii]|nr:MAG: hypothetical protein M1826_001816 [Phylliscum demangeonii]
MAVAAAFDDDGLLGLVSNASQPGPPKGTYLRPLADVSGQALQCSWETGENTAGTDMWPFGGVVVQYAPPGRRRVGEWSPDPGRGAGQRSDLPGRGDGNLFGPGTVVPDGDDGSETVAVIHRPTYLMHDVARSHMTPFRRTTVREVGRE